MSVRASVRVRAPELRGRGWLNTRGPGLDLAGLRGKIVLLDFWTFCCVNCLHVLDELRPLEERYRDVLVTIGVHSPKFVHEADERALADAVERYAVGHPVLDDPELVTWDAYAAKAWPTLVVVDPLGYVVAHLSGEGHAHGLAVLIDELVAEHEARGTLHRGDGPYLAPLAPDTALRFPGSAVTLPDGSLLVSDTAHHQLVHLEPDLVTERQRVGEGVRGLGDGPPGAARFSEPQGLAVLPADVAVRAGYDVVVADSVNHALRGVRLADGRVSTIAGTGAQLRHRVTADAGPLPATSQELSTPWDVVWWQNRVVVAMAGSHQLWTFDPGTDGEPGTGTGTAGETGTDVGPATVAVLGGTTNEGLVDGPAPQAWFAQPSGLAVDGTTGDLLVADAETSAVRRVTPGGAVTTLVGRGLFDFGFRDGAVGQALLQHPLDVAALPDGSVAVADTYNGAVRRIDQARGAVTTLARDLAEPSALLLETAPDGRAVLVVVESAAHRLVRVPVPAAALRVDAAAHQVRRRPTDLPAGPVRVAVHFTPPTGQHLDDRFGDPTQLTISATPPSLLVAGAGSGRGLDREVILAADTDGGVLHISAQAAACDDDGAASAACHRYQQDWGIPVHLVPALAEVDGPDDGRRTLDLHLRGV